MATPPINQTTSLARRGFTWDSAFLPNSRKLSNRSGTTSDFMLEPPRHPLQHTRPTKSDLKERPIIAHGLERFGNNKAAWKQVADAAFELSDRDLTVSRLSRSVYAFDVVGIIKHGEAEFRTALKKFQKHVKDELDKHNGKGLDPNPPKIVFVGHGIAEWLVKQLLVESSRSKDQVPAVDQVAGIIFLQPENLYTVRSSFDYEAFTENWVEFLHESGISGLPSIKLKDHRDDDDKDKTLPNLIQRLQWIDENFQTLLSGSDYLTYHTWVLQSPLSISEDRNGTERARPASSNRVRVTTLLNRRRRDQTTVSAGAVKEKQVEGINRFIQVLEDDLSGHSSGENAFATSISELRAWVQERLYERPYFSHSNTKDQHVRRSSLSTLPRIPSPVLETATNLSLEERALRLPSQDKYQSQHSTYEDKWKRMCDKAERYLSKGDLENADILCKRCVDMAEPTQHGIDEPLRWRMRRAIIAIERGQYQDGLAELDQLLDKCYIYKEGLRSGGIVWKPEPPWALTTGYQIRDMRSSWCLIPPQNLLESGSVVARSAQNPETEQYAVENLRILTLELLYQIATAFTATGKFRRAEDPVIRLREYFLVNQTSLNQDTSHLNRGTRELKLSVDVSRLLAILKGHQGSFSEAKALIDDSRSGEQVLEQVEPGNHGPKYLTRLAEAKILMLQGSTQEALELTANVFSDAEAELGTTHLTSLEARCLHAMLLTKTSQIEKAEAMVVESSDIATRHLGKQHPLVLEMAHILVSIYELQYRPLHALWTSESLTARSRKLFGAIDQRTIRFQGQLAWIHVRTGNYKRGLSLLEETYASAENLWGPTHQWTVTYLPKLAVAYALLGSSFESTKYFHAALTHHIAVLGMADSTDGRGQSLHDLIRELSSAVTPLETRRIVCSESIEAHRRGEAQHDKHCLSPRETHPEILSSLQLWAAAESNSTKGDMELLLEVQRIVYAARKVSKNFGKAHVLTLKAGLDLAKTTSKESGHGASETEDIYNELRLNAEEALDPNHPLLLSARYGLQKVQLVRNSSSLKSPACIAQFFLSIQEAMSFRLGDQHPDVLRASLETFEILRVVDSRGADKLSEEFLRHVRSDPVWDQRPIESVELQEQLAWLYFTHDEPQQALNILGELRTQLKAVADKSPDQDMWKTLLNGIKNAETAVLGTMQTAFNSNGYGGGVRTD